MIINGFIKFAGQTWRWNLIGGVLVIGAHAWRTERLSERSWLVSRMRGARREIHTIELPIGPRPVAPAPIIPRLSRRVVAKRLHLENV